jgi:O-antigen/teichoic acid export membrane protein
MLTRVKQLSKASLIYGLGGALARSISIILLLIYAPLFGTQLYGVLNDINATSALLLALLVFGIDGASGIYYFESDDEQHRQAVTSSWFYFSLMVSLPVCALLLLFADPIAQLATRSSQYAGLIQLSIIATPFTVISFAFNNILRLKFRPIAYVSLTLFTTALNVGVGLYLVLGLGMGMSGAVIATLVSSTLTAVVGWWLTRDSYGAGLNWALTSRMLRIAVPFAIASVALWVNNYISGPLLTQLAPDEKTGQSWAGIYGATLRISIIVALAVSAFQLAWSPYSLSIARQEDARRTYAKILTYFTILFGGLALALALFAREVLSLLDRNHQGYTQGYFILGLLSFASVALGAYYIVSIGSNIAKRTSNIGWTTVIAAAVSITLNYLLIPSMGFLGAGIATLAANLVSTILLYILSQRCYEVPYESGKVLLTLLLGLGLMAVGLTVGTGHWWLDALIKLGLLTAYAIALPLFGIITQREMSVVASGVMKRLRKGAV